MLILVFIYISELYYVYLFPGWRLVDTSRQLRQVRASGILSFSMTSLRAGTLNDQIQMVNRASSVFFYRQLFPTQFSVDPCSIGERPGAIVWAARVRLPLRDFRRKILQKNLKYLSYFILFYFLYKIYLKHSYQSKRGRSSNYTNE